MEVAPDYATTGHLYVIYTRAPSGAVEVDEFTADGDSVALSSGRRVLSVPHSGLYENGGQLEFGPDGLLYVTIGDNGEPENGQRLDTVLGKILRIDPRASGSAPYTIPADNPFAGSIPGLDEIWTYGTRNAWRLAFDRLTGAMVVGDVGQFHREEVDYFPGPAPARGANLGWDCREGTIAFPYAPSSCGPPSSYVEPIYDFPHPADDGCAAIVGGYVVRDSSLGDLYGRYLFTDTCNGTIRSLVPQLPTATDVRSEGLRVDDPSSFGEDSCGRVYVASLGNRGGLALRRRRAGELRCRRRRRARAAVRGRARDPSRRHGSRGRRLTRRRRDRRRRPEQPDQVGRRRRRHLRQGRPRQDPRRGRARQDPRRGRSRQVQGRSGQGPPAVLLGAVTPTDISSTSEGDEMPLGGARSRGHGGFAQP